MRDVILGRVREAIAGREVPEHPGRLETDAPAGEEILDVLEERLRAAGAEVHQHANHAAAGAWLEEFALEFGSMAAAPSLPPALLPDLPSAPPERAGVGISLALGGAAESGSLLLGSREGRRLQLLPATHLVWVRKADLHGSLEEAVAASSHDLPAVLALHSGPSKSADIGQVMVTGVHGPGRLVVGILLSD